MAGTPDSSQLAINVFPLFKQFPPDARLGWVYPYNKMPSFVGTGDLLTRIHCPSDKIYALLHVSNNLSGPAQHPYHNAASVRYYPHTLSQERLDPAAIGKTGAQLNTLLTSTLEAVWGPRADIFRRSDEGSNTASQYSSMEEIAQYPLEEEGNNVRGSSNSEALPVADSLSAVLLHRYNDKAVACHMAWVGDVINLKVVHDISQNRVSLVLLSVPVFSEGMRQANTCYREYIPDLMEGVDANNHNVYVVSLTTSLLDCIAKKLVTPGSTTELNGDALAVFFQSVFNQASGVVTAEGLAHFLRGELIESNMLLDDVTIAVAQVATAVSFIEKPEPGEPAIDAFHLPKDELVMLTVVTGWGISNIEHPSAWSPAEEYVREVDRTFVLRGLRGQYQAFGVENPVMAERKCWVERLHAPELSSREQLQEMFKKWRGDTVNYPDLSGYLNLVLYEVTDHDIEPLLEPKDGLDHLCGFLDEVVERVPDAGQRERIYQSMLKIVKRIDSKWYRHDIQSTLAVRNMAIEQLGVDWPAMETGKKFFDIDLLRGFKHAVDATKTKNQYREEKAKGSAYRERLNEARMDRGDFQLKALIIYSIYGNDLPFGAPECQLLEQAYRVLCSEPQPYLDIGNPPFSLASMPAYVPSRTPVPKKQEPPHVRELPRVGDPLVVCLRPKPGPLPALSFYRERLINGGPLNFSSDGGSDRDAGSDTDSDLDSDSGSEPE